LTFESVSMKKISNQKFYLTGNLTMRGVTKPVTLTVTYVGSIENQMSKKAIFGFHITGSVKRSDYGIGAKTPEAMVSDVVKIVADAEFSKD
ncbi:MAG TPA: YceI family protein, partial [Paludibacter sp.]